MTYPPLHPRILEVTARIAARSADSRQGYLERLQAARKAGPMRTHLACTNLAHGFAAADAPDKSSLKSSRWPNIAIVSAYNDMLSAHRPLERYPAIIKFAAREAGAVAQFAGGVPAMCDGVTQGQPGMELSLFSRDLIAMATAVALSHNMFDAVLCLGVCDKIVPGLFIGALSFGHLPTVFVPGGPMTSGLPNKAKARIRQLFAEGKVDRDALLESEAQSYHGEGTCTFYGTANSNQMLMEVMGVHLPGSAFVPPNTPLRDALTIAAAQRVAKLTAMGDEYLPMGEIVDERSLVNAIVGLLATGGSTNHTLHLVAMAKAAGVSIDWDDFNDLSEVTPLLARVYPNGSADVNHFHAAGGVGFLIRELLHAGLLHADARTVMGCGLHRYTQEPFLSERGLSWREAPLQSGDASVLRPASNPFSSDGGLKLLRGNLGRAVIKTSSLAAEHRVVTAPAIVFDDQADVVGAFHAGKLTCDCVVVVRYQGPRANGMPELHQLTPVLSSVQSKGFHVALITDGRMSGASGSVPAAIHVTPECSSDGPLRRVRNGDIIHLDSHRGIFEARVPLEEWLARDDCTPDLTQSATGMGRELFSSFRAMACAAEEGATTFGI